MSPFEFVPLTSFLAGLMLYHLAVRRDDISPYGRSKWLLLIGAIAAYVASATSSFVILALLIITGDA